MVPFPVATLKYHPHGITTPIHTAYLGCKINTLLKTIFTCLLLLAAAFAKAQHIDTLTNKISKDTLDKQIANMKKMQAKFDSMQAVQLQQLQDKAHVSDSINMARGLDEFVRLKAEQDKKLTTQLWIKGSFFVCMLAVTIVGFVRRKRQKVKGRQLRSTGGTGCYYKGPPVLSLQLYRHSNCWQMLLVWP